MNAPARLGLLFALPLFAACASAPASPAATAPSSGAAGAGGASTAAAPAKSEEEIFDACTASPLSGIGWAYDCEGIAATVTDSEDADLKLLLDGTEQGFRTSVKSGQVDATPATFEIAGEKLQGRRLTITVNGKAVAGADAAAFKVEGKGARLLSCGGALNDETAERCKLLLATLATSPWRGDVAKGVPVKSDEVTLAGRKITIPQGCNGAKQGEGAMIRCDGQPALWWAENPADAAAARKAFVDQIPGKKGRVACKIESVSSQCDVVSDDTGAVYTGNAKVRGKNVLVFCLAPNKVMPAPCKGVLAVSSK